MVFLTAAADDCTLTRVKIVEPLGYLVKPFEPRDLHTAIQMAFTHHRVCKRREVEALSKAAEYFRMKFEHAMAGMFQVTNGGEFLSANRALAHILGYESAKDLKSAYKNFIEVLDAAINPPKMLGRNVSKSNSSPEM